MAISDYLKSLDVPENGINAMADSLKQLGKGLFVTGCVSNKDEDEDEDDVRTAMVFQNLKIPNGYHNFRKLKSQKTPITPQHPLTFLQPSSIKLK